MSNFGAKLLILGWIVGFSNSVTYKIPEVGLIAFITCVVAGGCILLSAKAEAGR